MVVDASGWSQAQPATFDGYVQQWVKRMYEPGPIGEADRLQVVQAIRACYAAAGLAWHDNVVWVGSLARVSVWPKWPLSRGQGRADRRVHGQAGGVRRRFRGRCCGAGEFRIWLCA